MSKISRHDIWVILAGYLAALHVGKLSPLIPLIQKELNLTFTQAGLSLSLVQAAGMLFALSIGAFSEKLGLKRCFITGITILGLSSLGGYFIDHAYLLYLFRFGEGIGFLTISICAPAILKRISTPETLNFKLGLWSSYMGVGVSLAILTIPTLVEWFTWQQLWAILGFACFFIALMAQLFLKIEPLPQPTSTQSNGFLDILKVTLCHPPVLCLAIIFSCYTSQWITVVGFLPTMYLSYDIPLQTAGALVSLVVVANLVGTFGAGHLLQRGIRPAQLLNFGFISMLIMSGLTFWSKAWLPFEVQYLSAILFSLLGGVIPTTVFAITLQFAPRATAAAASVGLVLQISATAQFLVPPLSAALVSSSNQWGSIAWVTSTLAVIGLLMVCVLFGRYAHTKSS